MKLGNIHEYMSDNHSIKSNVKKSVRRKKIYERQELIDFLCWYYEKFGSIPKTRVLDSCSDYPSAGVFRRVFGSLDNAVIETGIFEEGEYKNFYTDHELLEYIWKYTKEFNAIPTVSGMDNAKKYPSSSTFTKRFGSLRNAVIESGVEMSIRVAQNYTEEKLLEYLISYVNDNGLPSVKDMDTAIGYPSSSTYRYRFGSLRKALIKANIELSDSYFIQYTEEELLDYLKEYYLNFGLITCSGLDSNSAFPSSRTYLKRFGGLSKAIKYAGLPVPNTFMDNYFYHILYNKEELIDLLIQYNKEYGLPTYDGVTTTKGYPTASVYVSNFGSWEKALISAGFEIPEKRKRNFERQTFSESIILEHLRYHTWLKLNTTFVKNSRSRVLLVHHEINEIDDIPSMTTIFKTFGGIKEAYKKIGYDYDKINKEQKKGYLIERFQKLAIFLKRVPRLSDLHIYSWYHGISVTAFYNTFKHITNLQKESGFTPIIYNQKRTNEELIEDLLWVKEKRNGRTPGMKDMMKYRNEVAHPHTYIKRFGGFLKAIKAAGLKPKSITYTLGGSMCRSIYEYDFYSMLENRGFEFIPSGYYKDYLPDLKRNFIFDATIWFQEKIYLFEIFGVTNNLKGYDDKTKIKKKYVKTIIYH